MLGVGTGVNLTATSLALAVMVQDGPDGLAVALHFLPMPYNVFLFVALWRMPDRNALASLIAGGWLVAMTPGVNIAPRAIGSYPAYPAVQHTVPPLKKSRLIHSSGSRSLNR
jgi:hypothetical protein